MSNINDRERLPGFLRADPITFAISDALYRMGSEAFAVVQSALLQFAPTTATWGLEAWEHITGQDGNATKPLETRRAMVVTQLSSRGTANAKAIERVVMALTGYAAKVTELPSEYAFLLEFLEATTGITANDKYQVLAAINTIKPAHLKVLYYLMVMDIHETMTLAQLEKTPLSSFAF